MFYFITLKSDSLQNSDGSRIFKDDGLLGLGAWTKFLVGYRGGTSSGVRKKNPRKRSSRTELPEDEQFS